jgi:hypothetical protein
MPANDGLQFIFGHVSPFHYDLVVHHDGRGSREIQFEVFIRLVLGYGFGDDLRLELILLAQPGHYFLEVLSGLAVGLVVKASDLKHDDLLTEVTPC